MSERGDAELVRAALAGDKEAYGELVTRYQGHVYGLGYSLVNDWTNAQDIAQETFIRAYCNLDQLREPEKFAAWLRRVTFGVAMNWLKAFRPGLFKKLDGQLDLDKLDVPDFQPGPAEAAEKRELAEAVLGAIASLPPKYRVPLTMFHLDGLSYQKVADFLDIPLGTAKSLIHRAQEKLRAALPPALVKEISMVQEVFNEHKLPAEFARAIIEGLQTVRWGAGDRENSVLGALVAALQAIGEPVSYEYLMGVSGAAFRLQMAQPEWCPSAPNATCGFDCKSEAIAALNYEVVPVGVKADDPASVERARQAVMESIRNGMPAVHVSYEDSLFVGYESKGDILLLRPYAARTDGYVTMKEWPWEVGILRRKAAAPDRAAAITRSLNLAVKLANMEQAEGYACGFRAYRLWIEQLRDASRFRDPKKTSAAMQANAHCYYSLSDARLSAAAYLRLIAPELSPEARSHVLRAAGDYGQLTALLNKRCPTELAPMPWMLKQGQSWTQEMRDEQATILSEALARERQAIGHIGEALKG